MIPREQKEANKMKYQIKQRVNVKELGCAGTIIQSKRSIWTLYLIPKYEVLLDNRANSVNKNLKMTCGSKGLEALAVQASEPENEAKSVYKTNLGQKNNPK